MTVLCPFSSSVYQFSANTITKQVLGTVNIVYPLAHPLQCQNLETTVTGLQERTERKDTIIEALTAQVVALKRSSALNVAVAASTVADELADGYTGFGTAAGELRSGNPGTRSDKGLETAQPGPSEAPMPPAILSARSPAEALDEYSAVLGDLAGTGAAGGVGTAVAAVTDSSSHPGHLAEALLAHLSAGLEQRLSESLAGLVDALVLRFSGTSGGDDAEARSLREGGQESGFPESEAHCDSPVTTEDGGAPGESGGASFGSESDGFCVDRDDDEDAKDGPRVDHAASPRSAPEPPQPAAPPGTVTVPLEQVQRLLADYAVSTSRCPHA